MDTRRAHISILQNLKKPSSIFHSVELLRRLANNEALGVDTVRSVLNYSRGGLPKPRRRHSIILSRLSRSDQSINTTKGCGAIDRGGCAERLAQAVFELGAPANLDNTPLVEPGVPSNVHPRR